jgi:hypothetical protein
MRVCCAFTESVKAMSLGKCRVMDARLVVLITLRKNRPLRSGVDALC